MARTCLILGLIFSTLSLTCMVTALASSQWFKIRVAPFHHDVGLMRHCDVLSLYCGDMEHLNALVEADYAVWFRSVQTLYLLHCVGMLVSTVSYILYMVQFLEFKSNFKFLTVLNLLALAAGIYAVAVFGSKSKEFFGITGPSLPTGAATFGYGLYVAIIGCCLSFVVMVLSATEAVQAVDILRNVQNRLTVWSTHYILFVNQEV